MSVKFSLRRMLFGISDVFLKLSKDARGAANRLEPSQKLNLTVCEAENWMNVRPGFVLSTGRCGTRMLNHLLELSPYAMPMHAPRPELIRVSKRAYMEVKQNSEIFAETFKSAREELVLNAAERDRVFVETNNRISFFAPVIRDVFPRAVFIHLVRHPGDFVRSGIRRKWYSGMHDTDVGRIVPFRGDMKNRWEDLSSIEKIGWLWNKTNQFIENFKTSLHEEEMLLVRAEDLFSNPEVTERIYSFLHLRGYDAQAVERRLKKPANVQRKGSYPPYNEWLDEDKESLMKITPLAKRYGYFT